MKILRGLLLAACLILGMQTANATSKKHEVAMNATFVLYGRSAERETDHAPLCTAFIYKKASDGYFLLTAGHCFSPNAPTDAVYLVAQGQITEKPDLRPVEVLNHVDDGKMDVAEIHLKTDKQYPVLELEDKPVNVDDDVFYVGYPKMYSQIVFTGRVASDLMQTLGPDKEDPCDLCIGRFLVQTGGGTGASGSPILSERTGRVIGILEGHLFENGVVVVPTPAIESYYAKVGHSQVEKLKNERSEEKDQ